MSVSSSGVPDAAAVGISGLCLAHCLALPLLAAVVPVLGALSHAGWVHILFFCAATPVSALALRATGGWRHPGVRALFHLGVTGLAAGLPWGWPEWIEVALTSLGSAALVAAHLLNLRRRAVHPAVVAMAAEN